MLHSVAGSGIDAAQHGGNAFVHQLSAHLALRFEKTGRRTRLRVDAQEPPWKVFRAFEQPNGGALVHLLNVSGGVLAGDDLSLRIDVGPAAVAQVTSTGATRLYRHRNGARTSRQHTEISVADGGLLEYLPDALVPFAGSRHAQTSTVTLAGGASLFSWEVVAPGRQAMDEVFAFESLRVKTMVRSAARPVSMEQFLLEPGARDLRSLARLGSYTHTASFYAIQIGRPAGDLRQLEAELNEIAREVSRPGVMIWGASALASGGVIVRGLSATARDLPATLARYWTTARRFLTGEDPVPPRKLR